MVRAELWKKWKIVRGVLDAMHRLGRLDKQMSTIPPKFVRIYENVTVKFLSTSHDKSLFLDCCFCLKDSIRSPPCVPGESVEMARY